MVSLKFQRLIIALLLIAGTILPNLNAGTITDTGSRLNYAETFESFNSGASPTDSWYNVASTGSGSQQVCATPTCTPITGTKSWQLTDTATGYSSQLNHLNAQADLCTNGASFSWSFSEFSGATASNFDMRLQTGAVVGTAQPFNSIGAQIVGVLGNDNIVLYIRGSSGAAATSTLPAVYSTGFVNVLVSQVNCTGTSASAIFTLTGAVTQTTALTTSGTTITGPLHNFGAASVGTVSTGGSIRLDDYALNGALKPAPTITNLSPIAGSAGGNTQVTITGTNFFQQGATNPTVTFGGIASPSVTFLGSTTLRARTPSHTSGLVSVTVTNPDGQSATLTNSYTYNPDPGSTECNGAYAHTEDFEYANVGESFPHACWYSWQGLNGAILATNSPAQGTRAASMNNAVGHNHNMILTNRPDVCLGQQPFLISLETRQGNAQGLQFGIADAASTAFNTNVGQAAGIEIGTSNHFVSISHGPAGATAVNLPTVPWAFGEWARFTLTIDCSSGGQTSITATMLNLNTQASNTVSTTKAGVLTATNVKFRTTATTTDVFDNIQVNGIPPPSAPSASVTVTGLTGFDVDRAGNTVIARLNGGGKIQTFSARDLAVKGPGTALLPTTDSGCNQLDGVSSIGGTVAYLECGKHDDSHGDPIQRDFRIASDFLGTPQGAISGVCSDGTSTETTTGFFCEQYAPSGQECTPDGTGDCQAAMLVIVPSSVGNIGRVEQYLYDYSTASTKSQNGVRDKVTVGFAFNNPTTGEIGVYTTTYNNNDADTDEMVMVPFAGGAGGLLDFCVNRNRIDPTTGLLGTGSGEDLIGGTQNAATKQFRVTANFDAHMNPHSQINPIWPSPTTAIIGIDCARNYVIGVTGTGDVILQTSRGPTTAPVALAHTNNPKVRGVALTNDARFASYMDGAEVVVLNLTSGAEVMRQPGPAGTFVDMAADNNGRGLWMASTTQIKYIDPSQFSGVTLAENQDCDAEKCQTITPTGCLDEDPQDGVCDSTQTTISDPGGTGGGINPSDDATFPGMSHDQLVTQAEAAGMQVDAYAAMICVFLVIAMGAGLYAFGKTFALVGAIGGFLLCFFFGLIALWVLLTALTLTVIAAFGVKSYF